ncbi:class I SAM-dependent methyltransferase [Desulfopila sp. IMCC35006]|uniref:class I SAM-dependent methyltransferase n=1 Tax=Desulfopila sp. IMCC35006 TaxID=2569542 RepID=UPI0010ACD1BF|nr:class I SAM-dependent methyltransferase [Desulfopila sp. IMCC35006]TKB23463.1 class I SAM-dependent methyltransferase [Desulfopila sp. IMCC35006]
MNSSTVQDSIFDSKLPLLGFLKQNNQDFEWYPTTEEMLSCINAHVNHRFSDRFSDKQPRVSVLDCGAGDGRSLESIANGGDMYAIEKSDRLIKAMSDDIYIVGTDFHQNTIIDKRVEVLFSNPPYSEYQEWSSKVIREANCTVVYLIIPTRWVDSIPIQEALDARDAAAEILGTFDFSHAERQARAVVNVLAIDLSNGRGEYRHNKEPKVDPFSVWFDEHFAFNADQSDNSSFAKESSKQKLSETIKQEVVNGRNLIQVLVELYNNEMQHLIKNYQAVGKLDYAILKELGVSISGLQKGLEQKIIGLKSKYWSEFFNNYNQITSRLTSASRDLSAAI